MKGAVVVVSAHCRGCGRRVDLTPEGECPQGHLRAMLRDVRQGVAAQPTSVPATGRVSRPNVASTDPSRSHEILAQVIGKSVVIVPVAAVIAFGVWTGYESYAGRGVSVLGALLLSVASLLFTVGLAFVWASRRNGRR